MDYLCPEIEQLVACFTCGGQTLPPYRLCVVAHVGCPPCTKYLSLCACGCRFSRGPHTTFDWLVTAMKLKCQYRADNNGQRVAVVPGSEDDCSNKWYTVQELREHYLTSCPRNLFVCPLQGCGHVARVETITDHYETAHGPFTSLSHGENQQLSNGVVFKIPAKKPAQVLQKIFNGYFLFSVKPQRRKLRDSNSPLAMQNINPSDPLRYTYTATMESNHKTFTVCVSLVEASHSPTYNT